MRKSGILIIGLAVLTAALFTGCGEKVDTDLSPIVVQTTDRFELYEDPYTGILYIKNQTQSYCYVYTPYFGPHGKLCKYIDGQIKEIE